MPSTEFLADAQEVELTKSLVVHQARKDAVVPESLIRVAEYLGVSVSGLLEETLTPAERAMDRLGAEAAAADLHDRLSAGRPPADDRR